MYRGLTREVLSILSWVAAAARLRLLRVQVQGRGRSRSPSSSTRPLLVAQVAIGGDHLPDRVDHRSPDHGAHLRHGARQPGRRHRPHPGLAVRRRARLRAGGDPLHVLRVVRATSRSSSTPGCAMPCRAPYDQVDRRNSLRIMLQRDGARPRSMGQPRATAGLHSCTIITGLCRRRWQARASCPISVLAPRHRSPECSGGRRVRCSRAGSRGRHDDCPQRGLTARRRARAGGPAATTRCARSAASSACSATRTRRR